MGRLRQQEKEFYLGWKFLTSLGTVLRLLYPRLDYAVLLTLASIVCAGGYEVASYNTGTIIGKFYSALLSKDEPRFWNLFWKATLIYFGQCLLQATTSFSTWLFYLVIRKNLVTALHHMYYRKNAYYSLNCVDNAGIDNPDQRITQDAERMCSTLAKNIFPYILISPGVIAWYTYKTWSTAGGLGVAIIYVYFVFGVIANRILVSPLTKWTARVEKGEGDFRYKHVSVRNCSEESTFYNAAEFEESESNRFLMRLLRTQLTATLWKYPAQFLQNYFDYYGAILSYLIQVFPIFILNSYKDMDGPTVAMKISNNAFFFIYLINSFTRLTDLALAIGEMAGYSQRIAELIRYLRRLNDEDNTKWTESDEEDTAILFATENLCYSSPGNTDDLVSNLTLKIPNDRTLLITGVSGVGKSSLLRIIRKLWSQSSGTIKRGFTMENTMFVPQRPYFPPGNLSLRQQIIFPQSNSNDDYEADLDNNQLINILESLHLRNLASMCGGLTDPPNFEWQDTLSPGEQQRLSFARVLYHKPSFVFLDEATSSLSVDAEANVYHLLGKYGISYLSVGHRTTLRSFHNIELRLQGRHEWKLLEISDGRELEAETMI